MFYYRRRGWHLPVDFGALVSGADFYFVYRWQKMLAILCHRWQKANTNQNYLSNPEQKKPVWRR
jgi:hypothetical protein